MTSFLGGDFWKQRRSDDVPEEFTLIFRAELESLFLGFVFSAGWICFCEKYFDGNPSAG